MQTNNILKCYKNINILFENTQIIKRWREEKQM